MLDFSIIRSTDLIENHYSQCGLSGEFKMIFKSSAFISVLVASQALSSTTIKEKFISKNKNLLCVTFPPYGKNLDYFFYVGIDFENFKKNLTLSRPNFKKDISDIITTFVCNNKDLIRILEQEHSRLDRHIKPKRELDIQVLAEFSFRISYFIDFFVQKGFFNKK